MSSRELSEWAAFEREYGPLGPVRGDWQAALVAHTVAGAHGVKGDMKDFMLNWSRPRPQSVEDQLTVLRAFASRGVSGGDDS